MTGLRLTESQFRDLLTNAGVTEVPAVGEAVRPGQARGGGDHGRRRRCREGQIVEELQKGYRYGEELLRPARVKVATQGLVGGAARDPHRDRD